MKASIRQFQRTIHNKRYIVVMTSSDKKENVWDYPRPPRLESTNKRLRVTYKGKVLENTNAHERILSSVIHTFIASDPVPPTPHSLHSLLQIIADTTSGKRILETSHPPTYYFPPQDVDHSFLQQSPGQQTLCEYKGLASYWDVITDTTNSDIVQRRAWSYETPTQQYSDLKGHICFYASPFDCYVDDEKVVPQPGGFYGGWVTHDIEGPFKGAPGTMGW